MINFIKESSVKIEIKSLCSIRDSISKIWNEFAFKSISIVYFKLYNNDTSFSICWLASELKLEVSAIIELMFGWWVNLEVLTSEIHIFTSRIRSIPSKKVVIGMEIQHLLLIAHSNCYIILSKFTNLNEWFRQIGEI